MKYLFNLGHPAHFHLFKNTMASLQASGHEVFIVIKRKDVLEDLLKKSGLEYVNFQPEGRGDGRAAIALGLLKRDLRLFGFCRRFKPDLLVGTSVEISHVGKILAIPSINVNEDDFDVVPLYSKLGYPWASAILAPSCCRTGRWEHKTVHYDSYHELAYLHPRNFVPDPVLADKYFPENQPFFLVRFAKLTAHHDRGMRGIDREIASRMIELLAPRGRVGITSERELEAEFEPYRMVIDPADMHQVMARASLYIGDSQTMAAEAGVLGVPFIRCNDFVGRIGYLAELEDKYRLGVGIRPHEPERLLEKIRELLAMKDLHEVFSERREKMLSEKIDAAKFLTWFLEEYPRSLATMRKDPDYQFRFKQLGDRR
jgi:predicted glycosyltransferase